MRVDSTARPVCPVLLDELPVPLPRWRAATRTSYGLVGLIDIARLRMLTNARGAFNRPPAKPSKPRQGVPRAALEACAIDQPMSISKLCARCCGPFYALLMSPTERTTSSPPGSGSLSHGRVALSGVRAKFDGFEVPRGVAHSVKWCFGSCRRPVRG